MRPRIVRRPSKRELSNHAAAFDALAMGCEVAPVMEQPKVRTTGPRGKQPESASNDAVKSWARYRAGVLYRNRRGFARTEDGGFPFGLGPNGYGDNIGYLTITVTPAMVGKRIAVYAMVECKRADKALKNPAEYGDQHKYVIEVRDAGGIAGFARQAEDAEAIYLRWWQRVTA